MIVPQQLRPRRRPIGGVGTAVLTASVLALIASAALGVNRASALLHEISETGLPGYLALHADPVAPNWQDLTPGDTVHWLMSASLSDAQTSSLDLELRSEGALVQAGELQVAVTACTEPFSSHGPGTTPGDFICESDASTVVEQTPLSAVAQPERGDLYALARLHAGAPRYLLVTLSVPETADLQAMAGTSMQVGVGLHASGDSDSSTMPPPTLVVTGADLYILGLLGVGLFGVVIGVALIRSARRHS